MIGMFICFVMLILFFCVGLNCYFCVVFIVVLFRLWLFDVFVMVMLVIVLLVEIFMVSVIWFFILVWNVVGGYCGGFMFLDVVFIVVLLWDWVGWDVFLVEGEVDVVGVEVVVGVWVGLFWFCCIWVWVLVIMFDGYFFCVVFFVVLLRNLYVFWLFLLFM